MKDLHIILDGGHGWGTKGNESPFLDDNGMTLLKENEFVDSMISKVSFGLYAKKIQYRITSAEWYTTGLSTRVMREKQYYEEANENSIFMSFHADATSSERPNGRTIFYHSQKGKGLAKHIDDYLLGDKSVKSRGVKKANYYVLRKTKSPAILIEFGFMTNESDLANLRDDAWRNVQAELIIDACVNLNLKF